MTFNWNGKMVPRVCNALLKEKKRSRMLIILNETSKDSTILKKKQPGSSNWSLALSEGAHIKRITDDAREDEILENLQAVGSVHSDLMMMTRAISGEIERQHKVLDEISNKNQKPFPSDKLVTHSKRKENHHLFCHPEEHKMSVVKELLAWAAK